MEYQAVGCPCHGEGEELHDVDIEVLTKSSYTWSNNILPGYRSGIPEITISRVTIHPQGKIALHKHPFITCAVVLAGTVTVTTADQQILQVSEGESFVETVDQWHTGENWSDVPAEMIVFYAGIQGQPVTVYAENDLC